jgi:glutathione S-transferase
VLPRDPAARAHARFLDEYADTHMADVLLWKVFGRALIAPAIFGKPRDLDAISATLRDEVPAVFDLLERWAPVEGFTFGATPGLADISVASHFANFRWARQAIDAARWSRTSAWLTRVEGQSPLRQLNDIGEKLLLVPPDRHGPVLRSLGVAVTGDTVGGSVPQRGPMSRI